jgi:predicted dehydrogenase
VKTVADRARRAAPVYSRSSYPEGGDADDGAEILDDPGDPRRSIVATPGGQPRRSSWKSALLAGKDVFVEKPLSIEHATKPRSSARPGRRKAAP